MEHDDRDPPKRPPDRADVWFRRIVGLIFAAFVVIALQQAFQARPSDPAVVEQGRGGAG